MRNSKLSETSALRCTELDHDRKRTLRYNFTFALSDCCFALPSIARRDTMLSFGVAPFVCEFVYERGGEDVPLTGERAIRVKEDEDEGGSKVVICLRWPTRLLIGTSGSDALSGGVQIIRLLLEGGSHPLLTNCCLLEDMVQKEGNIFLILCYPIYADDSLIRAIAGRKATSSHFCHRRRAHQGP